MTDKIKLLSMLATLVGIGYFLFLWLKPADVVINDDNYASMLKVDSLELVIAGYADKQAILDNEIYKLNDSIAYLNALIAYNDGQLADLKKKRNVKSLNISRFSTADIKKYWSNRYKDSIQSK